MLFRSRYRVGQEYRPHHDYMDPALPGAPAFLARGGQRVASLVMYLNTPTGGGATNFPDIGLEVAAIKGNAPAAVTQALADQSDDLRAVGLRIARMYSLDVIPVVEKLAKDASPLVRRECAIALRHNSSAKTPALWAQLAQQHDGKDQIGRAHV